MIALAPPFTANDMKGLYKKVLKGVYPKIPSHFSSDLASMVALLLQVDPKRRPSTEQILHMPVFIAKYNEAKASSDLDMREQHSDEIDLLGTIKVPRNLSLLTDRLPAANYETDKAAEEKARKKENKRLANNYSDLQMISEEVDEDLRPISGV